MNFKLLFFFAAVIAGWTACNQYDILDEVNRVDYEGEYAVPLVNTQFSIKEALESFEEGTTLYVDAEGVIHFTYSGDVITKTSEEVFASINETLSQFPIIPLLSNNQALPFASPDGLQMDRLDLKAGDFIYYFENSNDSPIEVTITLPQVTKNGEALTFNRTLPAWNGTGDEPFATNAFIPASLADYTILPADNDSIYIQYQAVDNQGNETEVSNIYVAIQNLEFWYAEGYLGNQIYEGGRDTIVIDFFDNYIRGDIYFTEPEITFNFENSFGIPTRSIVNIFNIFTVDGEVLPLESEFITNGIDFPYPRLDEVGQVKETQFVFTKDNSNIDVVLGSGPVAIDYDVNAFTNPDMLTDIRGFITDSSYYKVRVDVDLPLYGQAVDFTARDTFEVNLDRYQDVEGVEFKMVAENGLPLSADIQGYFQDENNVILDSLFDERQRVIAAAPVDDNGITTSTLEKVSYSDFPAGKFENILPAKTLVLVVTFSTYNDGNVPVKILDEQEVKVRIGAKFRVKQEF